MSCDGSVTHWLGQLKAGNHAAAQPLWECYFHRLVDLARHKLHGAARSVVDEEDIVLSAFASFCRGAEAGRFPQLHDRDDLWRLLVTITAGKAIDQVRRQHRHKHGGGQVLCETDLPEPADAAAGEPILEQVLGHEPTPEFAAQVAEECRRLLHDLADEELQSVALWKMEGYTNAEIAGKLGCVTRTIERKLQLIRDAWEPEGIS